MDYEKEISKIINSKHLSENDKKEMIEELKHQGKKKEKKILTFDELFDRTDYNIYDEEHLRACIDMFKEIKDIESSIITLKNDDPIKRFDLSFNTENNELRTTKYYLNRILNDKLNNIDVPKLARDLSISDLKSFLSLDDEKFKKECFNPNSLLNRIYVEFRTLYRNELTLPKYNKYNNKKGSTRVYLNIPDAKTHFDFVELITKKIIDNRIKVGIKATGCWSNFARDNLVLYTNEDDLLKLCSIVEEIIEENPLLAKKIKTPTAACYRVKDKNNVPIYSIADNHPKLSPHMTYNSVILSSFMSLMLYLIKKGKIENTQIYNLIKNDDLRKKYLLREFIKIDSNIQTPDMDDIQNYLLNHDLENDEMEYLTYVASNTAKRYVLVFPYEVEYVPGQIDLKLEEYLKKRNKNAKENINSKFKTINKDNNLPNKKDSSNKIEINNNITAGKKKRILYETEELLNSVFVKFLSSPKETMEKTIEFIFDIEKLYSSYRALSGLEMNYRISPRYKKIITIFDELKSFSLYTKKTGMFMKKCYYYDMAKEIEKYYYNNLSKINSLIEKSEDTKKLEL